MTRAPKISTCQHRGKLCFRWKQNGRPRYRLVQPGDQEQQRAQLLLEIMGGPHLKQRLKTLPEHIDDWVAILRAKHSERYAIDMERRLCRIIAAAKFKRITDLHVDRVELALADDPVMSALSEQSLNHHRMSAKQFARWLWLSKRHSEHALIGLRLPKVRTQRRRRDRFMPEELLDLIAITETSQRNTEYPGVVRAWIYRLACCTGLRRGELAALTPACFDLPQKAVRVASSYTKNGDPATCPLPAKVVRGLSRWLSGYAPDQHLFPGLRLKRVSDLLHQDMTEAGIPERTSEGRRSFHSLRNSYIPALWDAGLTGTLVQRLARHSNLDLTVKYARLAPGAEAAAVELPPCLMGHPHSGLLGPLRIGSAPRRAFPLAIFVGI